MVVSILDELVIFLFCFIYCVHCSIAMLSHLRFLLFQNVKIACEFIVEDLKELSTDLFE